MLSALLELQGVEIPCPNQQNRSFAKASARAFQSSTHRIEGVLEAWSVTTTRLKCLRSPFEVFSDGFTSGFPVRAFFMDRRTPSTSSGKVSMQRILPRSIQACSKSTAFMPKNLNRSLREQSPESDAWSLAVGELIQWFAAHGRESVAQLSLAGHDCGS